MAGRIPRPCSGSSSCPNPGTYRGKCKAHATEYEARRNEDRAESLDVYRSTRWRKLRARFLRRSPWCSEPGCHNAATDVDHVVPISAGGNPWDEANLQGLCHRHHSRKTATLDRRRPT